MSYHIVNKPIMRFVGIRTPMIEDMEENQRIVPEFWEHTLSNNQFMQLCQMGDELPNKILGISVYQDPENIFTILHLLQSKKYRSECLSLKSQLQHG